MKPAAFDYVRPDSVAEAVATLARHGGDAKLLAGGQSLVPLLNFRMLRPAMLVDINGLRDLDFVEEDAGGLRIGALTRHCTLETSPLVRARQPVMAAAMRHIAHVAIRSRGTIGGSLAHADPAAELPMLAVLLDAEIRTASPAGPRDHLARDFFLGPLTTALAEDELVTEVAFPAVPAGTGWGFEEMALRHGDFAIAAVAATVTLADGTVSAVRLAATGVGDAPVRLREAEAALLGRSLDTGVIRAAAERARDDVRPETDLRASAEFRRHLVMALTERAVAAAWRRAAGETSR